ncbi:MAG TPA: sodium:solute symporter family protein [Gemmatimonadales bacterium]|nr:sodium:solute symporter family protein [Gemmatimonadales bacterium]
MDRPPDAAVTALDWVVVGAYIAMSLALGLWVARRGARNLAEFFVGGRAIPWWLAATSMAATTFNVDTPLYVAGRVARAGVAGNWEWWCFAFAHVLLAVMLAKLWRRASVVTDLELIELRYDGPPAAFLRGFRAFLFAVPLNCISIGYAMLALRKVAAGLGLFEGLHGLPGDPRLWALMPIVVVTLTYTAVAGLWGVVVTDLLQYILAMLGALLVMGYALREVGGLHALTADLRAAGQGAHLQLVPHGEDALLPLSTMLGYLFIQWWAFRNSDGGGMFVQRLSATADEREAARASHLFNVLNYVVRTWPWVLVGLAALVLLPGLKDPELAYPLLMRRYLPPGVLGLVFASLVAAFMSSVSTQINWGASYLVNDLYGRFARVRDERKLLAAARLASVVLTLLAATLSFFMDDVGQVFRFLILIGNGPGLVLLLRWFWWRINAWAEIAAMAASPVFALVSFWPGFEGATFGARIAWTALGTMAVWVPVMLWTQPERPEVLERFYRRVRPGGAWGPQAAATGLAPLDRLSRDLGRWLVACAVLLAGMLGVGALLLR